MASKISDEFREPFEKKAFAHLATVMNDGTPQVTPVWCDYDSTHVRINSAKGRLKDKNMRRNKKVAFSIQDQDNPYRFIAVSGEVVNIADNNDHHINSLAKKYIEQGK